MERRTSIEPKGGKERIKICSLYIIIIRRRSERRNKVATSLGQFVESCAENSTEGSYGHRELRTRTRTIRLTTGRAPAIRR